MKPFDAAPVATRGRRCIKESLRPETRLAVGVAAAVALHHRDVPQAPVW